MSSGSGTIWDTEHPGGHAPYCVSPVHSLITYCAADESEPATMRGEPSKAWLRDHPGRDPRWPLVLASRDELDLSELRRHVNEVHAPHLLIRGGKRLRPVPRANRDLAPWHWGQHHRYHLGHVHEGLFVLVRDDRGSTTGQIPRPLGWYTGQSAKDREQAAAEWLRRSQDRRQ
jgi:hypothetical protein